MKITSILDRSTFHSECYLVETQLGSILIDPSSSLESAIAQNVDISKIKGIFITHGHFDHFLSLDIWLSATNTDVFIGKEDVDKLQNPDFNGSVSLGVPPVFSSCIPTPLSDGQITSLAGLTIEAIATPGHTSGSLCYLVRDKEDIALFSGDLIFEDGGFGRTDLPTGSTHEIVKSIKKILTLPDDITVYSGHGNRPFSIKEYKSHFQHLK